MAEDPAKLNIRRLEPAIQKFVKVAIPTDLERLQKHQINIEKYQRWSQWDKLHQEHINASRTVQQLRANMREMETLCLRVRDEDSQALEKIIKPVQKRAAAAVLEFLKLHSELVEEPGGHCNMGNSQGPHSSLVRSQTVEGTLMSSQESGSPLSQNLVQLNVPLPQIPQDQDAAESWEKLEENLIDLSNLVNEFSQLLHIGLAFVVSSEAAAVSADFKGSCYKALLISDMNSTFLGNFALISAIGNIWFPATVKSSSRLSSQSC
ncbi:syntaxin-17 isoform X2 [Carcharodon carcharias]|uniref:syntaxin-17 isoform X2 n=1 Tax=Carcharodon carcharias TaxID=13397 RepID=UPI001B7EAA7B|nr:syntaxin-17 isoform X2 [Carcharodon carcharias]